MKRINVFYITVVALAVSLIIIGLRHDRTAVSFYGFAETEETEINFNYPTAVGKIHVSPGDYVRKGEPLLDLYRIKPKEKLDDEAYRINELEAQRRVWQTDLKSEIDRLTSAKMTAMREVDNRLIAVEDEIAFRKAMYEGLETVDTIAFSYKPLDAKRQRILDDRSSIGSSFDLKIEALNKKLEVGASPYDLEIERIMAESRFYQDQKVIKDTLVAPADGVVGSIQCREEEHVPSFKTLISFYEPHPTQVVGYVHEDMLLHVALADSFIVQSAKDMNTTCTGIVTGLGSRIVEIPERLRRVPEVKTYGREVLIKIPSENAFLQKEKVVLTWVDPPEGLTDMTPRRSVTGHQPRQRDQVEW